jgi:RNA polymerase sigma factor (sigma-70 family)
MPGTPLGTILRHVRGLALPPGSRGETDAQLLGRFARHRDEAAFAALMQRHGGLVWGVCRNVLTHEQDTEDAFQATFLALAQQAALIRSADALGGWLHGTAFRIAMRAKRDAGRRRNYEKRARPAAEPGPATEGAWRELKQALDEEVQRLPVRQRAAFALCVLEGKTLAEASAMLGWKPGTVSGTLARARQLLRARLARRGHTLSALLTGMAVATATAPAAAPLRNATLRLALGDAAAVPARIAALIPEVTKTMLLTKANVLTAALLALALAGGSGALALWAGGGAASPIGKASPAKTTSEPAAPQGDPLPPRAVGRLGTLRFRHAEGLEAFALARDGKRLATAAGNAVVVWDTATGQELRRFDNHASTVHAVAFSPRARRIATAAADSLIHIWDMSTGKELHTLRGHRGTREVIGKAGETMSVNGVYSLAFTPDGKKLISRGVDQTIRVWDIPTGKELRRIEEVPGPAQALALAPDGKTIAAVVSDFPKRPSEVRLWQTNSGREIQRFSRTGLLTCVAFSPDGKLVAAGWGPNGNLSGETGGDVRLWKVATGEAAGTLKGHKRLVAAVAFAPDGKTLLSGSFDCTTRLWDVATGRELRRVGEGLMPVCAAAFSPDSRLLVMRAGYVGDHTVRFWDMRGAKEMRRLGGHRSHVAALAFSPDGRLLASGSADRTVGVWDVAGRKELERLPAHDAEVIAVAFSADGRTLRSGGSAGNIHSWDPATAKEGDGFETHDGWSPRCAFSADGKLLASWPRRGEAGHVWDTATGKELRRLKGVPKWVNALAFSPDGKLLAVGAGEGPRFITLYDVATGRPLREFAAEGWVLSLAFAPDGRTLVSGHDDKKIRVWEVATGGERLALDHGGRPAVLAFSPDGRLLASACNEARSNGAASGMTPPLTPAAGPPPRDRYKIRIWDPFTGERLDTLAGHRGGAVSLAFSPDGALLASGGNDTTILLWDAARLRRAKPSPRKDLGALELEACWQALADGDAAAGYRAIGRLCAAPRGAVRLLQKHLRPVAPADRKRADRLIADLDDDNFQTRRRAFRELKKLGAKAEDALRKALSDGPSPEAGRRIEALLDAVRGREVGITRGVEVLERVGTAEAYRLLAAMARGLPDARLTREAAAAAKRLAKKARKP